MTVRFLDVDVQQPAASRFPGDVAIYSNVQTATGNEQHIYALNAVRLAFLYTKILTNLDLGKCGVSGDQS